MNTPLIVTVVATLTNTVFNWLLIYGNLGFPGLGVRGAALATVIARLVELALFVIVYARTKPDFAVPLRDIFKIDGALFRNILKKGALVLFCEMVWVLSETVTTALYNGRGGADVVSGMAASFAIANLYFVAFGGIYSATGVILGKTLGEGDLLCTPITLPEAVLNEMAKGEHKLVLNFVSGKTAELKKTLTEEMEPVKSPLRLVP